MVQPRLKDRLDFILKHFQMGKAPAFQFYALDRASDIAGLDNMAVGAWVKAMMYLWTIGPMSKERLHMIAGDGVERVAFLFTENNGLLSLEWMEELREKQRAYRDSQAEHGSKGGRPSKVKKATLKREKGYPKGRKYEEEDRSKKKEGGNLKDEAFEKFWIAYERKGNRKSAEQEWQKISPEDHAAIMANVPKYNASKPDMQFRRDGERYLKHRVWEDAIVIPTNKTATNGQARTQAERDAELDRIVDERYGL